MYYTNSIGLAAFQKQIAVLPKKIFLYGACRI